jgi:hypothetical protein
VAEFLPEDRRAMCEEISQGTGISPTSSFRILKNDLQKRKVCGRLSLQNNSDYFLNP